MKRNLGKNIMIIIGVLIILVTVVTGRQAIADFPLIMEQERSVVFLDEPVIDEANEGKVVAISGTLSTLTAPYDKDFGLTFPYPVVQKQVYSYNYQRRTNNKQDYEIYDGDWGTVPSKSTLDSELTMGGFEIEDSLINQIPSQCSAVMHIMNFNEFSNDELSGIYVYKINGQYLLSKRKVPTGSETFYDTQGPSYKATGYAYMTEDTVLTVIGIQQGSQLTKSRVKKSIYEGAITTADMELTEAGDIKMIYVGMGIMIVIGAVLIILGLVNRTKKPVPRAVTSNTYSRSASGRKTQKSVNRSKKSQTSSQKKDGQSVPLICPWCGTQISGGRFCESCGGPLNN